MLRSREQDGGATLARRSSGRRQNVFDALFMPPLPELTVARGLMSALTPMLTEASQYVPQVELSERDGNYVIEVALPGFRKEDIDVEISGNEVTISGRYQRRREDAKTHYTEMQQASFSRTIVLPQEVDVDRVTATVEDGILRIVAPPMSQISSRKVAVTGQDSSGGGGQGTTAPSVSGETTGTSGSSSASSSQQTGGSQTATAAQQGAGR
jgi:HSP20 family protein